MRPIETDLTKERLDSLVRYDNESGVFSWLVSTNGRIKVGQQALSRHKTHRTFYVRINIDGFRHYAHRLAWLHYYGEFPPEGMTVDHIDCDGMNNRIDNLRLLSYKDNCRNKRENAANKSGVNGVCFNRFRGMWNAYINIDVSKQNDLGHYGNIFDAACARKSAEIEHGYMHKHGAKRDA